MNVMLYQLLEEARELWDMRLRDKKKVDSEYERRGICSSFFLIETIGGKYYTGIREYHISKYEKGFVVIEVELNVMTCQYFLENKN